MKCFMCGAEVDGQLLRTTLPKELLGKDENGNMFEDQQPVCKKCYYFKRAVDNNFINLCNDAKLFEWYRAKSTKRGEYFPPELVYNVDIEVLRELYYKIMDICEAADRIASNEEHRIELEDEMNYNWRNKDE